MGWLGVVRSVGGLLPDGRGDVDLLIDEDNMASDSATKVPTQQSVKAHVAALSDTYVASADVRTIVQVTQAAYDLLTPDADTLYVIVG